MSATSTPTFEFDTGEYVEGSVAMSAADNKGAADDMPLRNINVGDGLAISHSGDQAYLYLEPRTLDDYTVNELTRRLQEHQRSSPSVPIVLGDRQYNLTPNSGGFLMTPPGVSYAPLHTEPAEMLHPNVKMLLNILLSDQQTLMQKLAIAVLMGDKAAALALRDKIDDEYKE